MKRPILIILAILLVAGLYVLAARLGLILALPPGYATPFWPPSGIATAAVLMLGNWIWPGIFLGSFIANMLTTTGQISVSLFVSSGIAIGSTLQALAVGYLINRYAEGMNFFRHHTSVFYFIISTFVGCLIASSIGLTFLTVANVVNIHAFGANWVTWWLGDSVGIFVFTTFIIAAIKTFNPEELFEQFLEAVQICIYIAVIAILCFWDWVGHGYPIEYMFIPFLIWAIFRFEPFFFTALLVLISCIAVWGTSNGFGPFARTSTNESLLLLQAFIGIFATGLLFMSAVLHELDLAFEKLEEFNMLLQEQVANSDKPKTLPMPISQNHLSSIKTHHLSHTIKHQKHAFVDFNGLVIGFTNLAYLNRQTSEDSFKLSLNKNLDPHIGLVEISPLDFSRALILLLDNAFDSVINTEEPEVQVDTKDLGSKVSITIRNNGQNPSKEENKVRLSECYELIVNKLKGELNLLKEGDVLNYQIIFPKLSNHHHA